MRKGVQRMLVDSGRVAAASGDEAPGLLLAGTEAAGEYHCAECGYGVAVRRVLPMCPMCGGRLWARVGSSRLVFG